jgi:hypothetical protein
MKAHRFIPALVLVVLLLAACSQQVVFPEPTAVLPAPAPNLSPLEPGATTPATGPDFDALLTRLAASGVAVQSGGLTTGSLFNGAGHIVRVKDAEVQVFAYKDAAALSADTANVSTDGGKLGAAIVDWAGMPHFYRRGTLLAVYVGTDPLIEYILAASLGPQFAGGALAVLPAATGTAIAASSTASAIAAAATAAALAPQITTTPTHQGVACTDRAVLAADVTYPDGAVVPGGKSFLKTWRLRNTGTCTWSTAYTLVFVRGEQMGAAAAVPFTAELKPGNSADLSVNLTAPGSRGTYRGYWQLRNAAGKNFGIGGPGDGSFWVEIAVTSPTSVALPPATAAATPAPTQVPTPTGVPTAAPPTLETPPGPTPTPTLAPTPAVGMTPEPTGPERVVFQAGATSVTLTLDLSADGAKVFIVGAKAGQRLTITATQTGLSLDVVGPKGASLAPAAGSTAGNWTVLLPLTGDYVVLLQGAGLGQITFTLP